MWNFIKELRRKDHQRYLGGLDFFKYIGPGLLVTVGFIDPGNWASNFAAGADFGYSLLWVITLSTIMLIVLQHNVAHLGIVTGLCLSEAATKYTPKWVSRPILGTAVLASISTSLAEILGGAIALEMLFDIPIIWGSLLTAFFVTIMLFTNSYKRIERSIIAFVSVIGLSFLYELFLVDIDWPLAARSWVTPSIPEGSLLVIMSVLGAVVIGAIFLLLMWRLCQNRCTGETLFLTVILVYFLMENKCFLFSADPFILLLPAALFPAKGKPLPVVCPPVTRGYI